jgi:methionyl-tRNA synthetase
MSKTAGTAVSLGTAIDRYGPDALRYFLLREVGFENDGNFSWERFDARYVADLADTFGNLVSRSLSMTVSYRGGVVPPTNDASPLERAAQETVTAYQQAMDAYDLQRGAALIIELAARANRYVVETEPWKLAKAKHDAALDVALGSLVRTVARLAVVVAPFIPAKAEELWRVLGADRQLANLRLTELASLSVAGWKVAKPPPLFPKPDAG